MTLAGKPPSEAQLAYARNLSLPVAPDATAEEVSDLLTASEQHGRPATPELQAFARQVGSRLTRETCLEEIYDRITMVLMAPDRSVDLAAWYAFHVLQDLGISVSGQTDPVLRDLGSQLAADESVVRSMRRGGQGRWLRFGEWLGVDGWPQRGGSRDTTAYKATTSKIRSRFGMDATHHQRPAQSQDIDPGRSATANSGGCMSVVLGAAILIAFAIRHT